MAHTEMTFTRKYRYIFIGCCLVLVLPNHGFLVQIFSNAWIVEQVYAVKCTEECRRNSSQIFICGRHADPLCVRQVKEKLGREYPSEFVDIFFDPDVGLILLWHREDENVRAALQNVGFNISGKLIQTSTLRQDSMRLLFLSGFLSFLPGLLLLRTMG